MREPPIRRIDLDPTTRYKYRYTIDGGGVISVRFGGRCGDVITISDVTQMSESAAGAWGVGHGVAWPALQKLANRITYHLKSRLATGKAKGSYVLPKAMELASAGCALKLATQTPWAYSPEPIPRRSKG
jgi:hypothetical protein